MNRYHGPYSKVMRRQLPCNAYEDSPDENTAAPTIQRQVTSPTYTILPPAAALPVKKVVVLTDVCHGQVSNSIEASADQTQGVRLNQINPSVDSTSLSVLFRRPAQRFSGQKLAEFNRASFSLNAGNPPFEVQTSLGLATVHE
ncbi:hypothetical protein N7G274_002622 [Stereocaulon virgatum]|uniref:Uncharacterized protein n=1 Tax=Stereocaulon virgatum TaxID=373712 RepID=A0ABR4AGB3_9LECA